MTEFEQVMLNVLHVDPATCNDTEYDWCASVYKIAQRASESGLTAHLTLLQTKGPLVDVDIHQNYNRQLIDLGCAALILQQGIPGYIACTESGARVLAVIQFLEN